MFFQYVEKRRATLADYKREYAEENVTLDMTIVPWKLKRNKKHDLIKDTQNTASDDKPCCSTSRGLTIEMLAEISETDVIGVSNFLFRMGRNKDMQFQNRVEDILLKSDRKYIIITYVSFAWITCPGKP